MSGKGDAVARGPRSEGGEAATRLQRQAQALGSPTRFEIFQHVANASAPVRISALAKRFGLNHNAIRQHLLKLCEAGLLVEEVATPSGRGRPALQYRLAPDAAGRWGTPSPYEQLTLLLLEMAAEGLSPREAGLRAGRRAAAAADIDPDRSVEGLVEDIRSQGFEPHTVESEAGVDVVLDYCPYSPAAASRPEIVCEMHRGLAEGFLDELGTGIQVTALHIRRPGGPGCRLELRPTRTAPVDD